MQKRLQQTTSTDNLDRQPRQTTSTDNLDRPQGIATATALKREAKIAYTDLNRPKKSALGKTHVTEQIAMHEAPLKIVKETLIPSAQNPAFEDHLEKTQAAISEHLEPAKMLDAKLQSRAVV